MGWESNDMYNPIVYRMLPPTNFGSERYSINNEDFKIDSRKDDITIQLKAIQFQNPHPNVLNINVFPAKS